MTPERYRRVNEIFDAAADLDPAEREAFLARETAGDDDLRAEVSRLLAHIDSEDAILDRAVPGVRDAARPPAVIEPGTVVAGRFKVLSFAGRDACSEVYLAEGATLYVLDVSPEKAREIEPIVARASKVKHRHVSTLLGLFPFELGGNPAVLLAEESVPGKDLVAAQQGRPPFTVSEAVPILEQLAAALHALHEHRVIHAGIHPRYIQIASNGSGVRLGGLCLPRLPGAAEAADPIWLAPEQLLGEPVTTATDVYAYGLVAFEMLTGHKPFLGTDPTQTALRRLHEAPISPLSLKPDLPAICAAALLRCLEREPMRRPPDVRQVASVFRGQMGFWSRLKGLSFPGRSG